MKEIQTTIEELELYIDTISRAIDQKLRFVDFGHLIDLKCFLQRIQTNLLQNHKDEYDQVRTHTQYEAIKECIKGAPDALNFWDKVIQNSKQIQDSSKKEIPVIQKYTGTESIFKVRLHEWTYYFLESKYNTMLDQNNLLISKGIGPSLDDYAEVVFYRGKIVKNLTNTDAACVAEFDTFFEPITLW